MAKVRQFMIGHVVTPVAQFGGYQTNKLHWKELVPCAMRNVDWQTARLCATLMWSQDASDDCQTGEAFWKGETDVIAKRTAIGEAGEQDTAGIDSVTSLHIFQHQEQ